MKKMSIKNLHFALIAALFVMLFFVGTTSAWYFTAAKLDMGSVTGGVSYLANYFESGDGSAEQPYEIAKPEQLYNLAWLQYLGAFNQTGEPDFTPFHFYISDRYSDVLDMTRFVLPPIGTQTYPFIGYLDGRGNTVANLTVANVTTQDANEAAKIFEVPQNVKYLEGTNVSGVEIIGFMGVVGPLTGAGTYASATNALKDLTIQNITVNTETDSALIGLAAGYVNGPVSNVAVVGGTVKIKSGTTAVDASNYTENLSDYGIVGYATEDYRANVAQDGSVSYHFVTAQKPLFINQMLEKELLQAGNDASWGGSIGMESMYTHLQNKWTQAKRNANYSYSYSPGKTIRHYIDGTTTETPNANTNVTYSVNAWTNAGTSYLKAIPWDGSGQYVFVNRTDTSNFTYLFGRREHAYTTTEITEYYGQRISNNGYYLNANTSAASASATAQTYWVIDSVNHQIYCYPNGDSTKYYLNYANGNLSVSVTPTSNWTYSDGKIYLGIGTTGDQLYCQSGTWKVDGLTEGTDQYRISFTYNGNTYYLKYNGENQAVAVDTNVNNASTWNLIDNKVVVPGTNIQLVQYLLYYAYASETRGTAYTKKDDNKLWREGNATYLRYNGSWANSRENNATTFTFTPITYALNKDITIGAQTLLTYSDVTNGTVYGGIPTVFPLKFDNNGATDTGNTGYVIAAGSNSIGDIRVSKYAMSNINIALNQNAYANTKLEVITRTAAGWRRISDTYNGNNTNVHRNISGITKQSVSSLGLTHYDNARKNLEAIFTKDSSNIYGLHFIDSRISKDRLINVPAGYINGDAFTNLKMPEDCIDFHLKTPGKINFFAGTYFSGNSNFFSLHHIYRDENQNITAIKEIKEIYENAEDDDEHKYVYKYDDGTYSVGTPKGSYIFHTDWITAPDTFVDNAVYYFEVPANGGEYALGSVSGGDGAYLMYLDIAANGKLTSDEAFISMIHTVDAVEHRTYEFETPLGVDFVDPNVSNPIQYANATVKLNGYGTIQFGRSGDTIQGVTSDATLTQTLTFLENQQNYNKNQSVLLTEPEEFPDDYVVNDEIYSKKLEIKVNDLLMGVDDVITIQYQYDHSNCDDVVRILYADPLIYMIMYNNDALIPFEGTNRKIEISTNAGFSGEIFTCAVSGEGNNPPSVTSNRQFTSLTDGRTFTLAQKESYIGAYPENSEELFSVNSDEATIVTGYTNAASSGYMNFTYNVSGTELQDVETYGNSVSVPTDTAVAKVIGYSMEIPTWENNYGLDENGNIISVRSAGKASLAQGGKQLLGSKGPAKLDVSGDVETPKEDADFSAAENNLIQETVKEYPYPDTYSICYEGPNIIETDPESMDGLEEITEEETEEEVSEEEAAEEENTEEESSEEVTEEEVPEEEATEEESLEEVTEEEVPEEEAAEEESLEEVTEEEVSEEEATEEENSEEVTEEEVPEEEAAEEESSEEVTEEEVPEEEAAEEESLEEATEEEVSEEEATEEGSSEVMSEETLEATEVMPKEEVNNNLSSE